jgi:hypothetical protein
MPRIGIMHVRWPEGYFTDKDPSLVILGYIYSVKGKPLTILYLALINNSNCVNLSRLGKIA